MSDTQPDASKPDRFPRMVYFIAILTVSLLVSFLVSIVLLYFFEIPVANRETLVYMLGQLSGFTNACILFWVSTTHSSGLKTDIISKSSPVQE